jgi:hypothetical protein
MTVFLHADLTLEILVACQITKLEPPMPHSGHWKCQHPPAIAISSLVLVRRRLRPSLATYSRDRKTSAMSGTRVQFEDRTTASLPSGLMSPTRILRHWVVQAPAHGCNVHVIG